MMKTLPNGHLILKGKQCRVIINRKTIPEEAEWRATSLSTRALHEVISCDAFDYIRVETVERNRWDRISSNSSSFEIIGTDVSM